MLAKDMKFQIYKLEIYSGKAANKYVRTSKGYNIGWCKWFCGNFEIIIFCFVVAICDLVHDVEAVHDLR